MSVVIPGRGWSCFLRGVPETAMWGLLGPFAEGSFVRRVRLHVSADAAIAAAVGVVLGPSGEATEGGFRAGKSLLDRSTDYAYGSPGIVIDMPLGLSSAMVLSPGIEVHSGSRYCVVYFETAVGPSRVSLLVSVEVMEARAEAAEIPG